MHDYVLIASLTTTCNLFCYVLIIKVEKHVSKHTALYGA